MDYGYQLLRHVVQQVFGNLGPAARITVVPALLAYVLCFGILYLIAGPTFIELMEADAAGATADNPFETDEEAMAFAGSIMLGFIVCIPVFLIFYSWAAVGWHRYVLLEEGARGFAAAWSWEQIKSYIGAIIRLSLMMIALGFVAGFVIAIVAGAFPSQGVIILFTIGLAIGFTWAFTRLGLVLPAAAIGERLKLGESWNATARVSGEILLPIIVIPLVFFIVNSALALLGVIGFILTIGIYWLQLLVNLALLTTLYGNLIEGRQLN